jgi:hypothetical protein
MPGYLLNQQSTIICVHAGQATPTGPNPRVMVSGAPVTTQGPPYVIAGCLDPPPIAGTGPCVTGLWVSAATRVLAGGLPVLLQDSQAVCAPTGTGLIVVVTQPRVSGV